MRPTIAEINLRAIGENFDRIKAKVSPSGVIAVVKANAYGHGVEPVSRILLERGADYLGVACLEEGIELRNAGIDAPILVFSSAGLNKFSSYLEHRLEATIFQDQDLHNLNKTAVANDDIAPIHIKVDTGMNRMGVSWERAANFIQTAARLPGIQVKGVYTHFAQSDHIDKSFTLLQLARFNRVIEQIEAEGISVPFKHAANSGAILDIPSSYFDLVRPGILLYGYYPSAATSQSIEVQPAMTFKTRVVFIKDIDRGESVSYDRTFIAQKPTRVASLPVGYADGYNRLLSNSGSVWIRQKAFPVIGRVCMDIILVDLGEDQSIEIGDDAILFGHHHESVSVETICEKINTIPYEVTCRVSERVPRMYTKREAQ